MASSQESFSIVDEIDLIAKVHCRFQIVSSFRKILMLWQVTLTLSITYQIVKDNHTLTSTVISETLYLSHSAHHHPLTRSSPNGIDQAG